MNSSSVQSKDGYFSISGIEAFLKRKAVKNYAKENNVSLDEAVEILGREYISKYGAYCISRPLTRMQLMVVD